MEDLDEMQGLLSGGGGGGQRWPLFFQWRIKSPGESEETKEPKDLRSQRTETRLPRTCEEVKPGCPVSMGYFLERTLAKCISHS